MTEAILTVHEELEGLLHRLQASLLQQEQEPVAMEELQELVTEAAVTLVEYKGLARESAVAVEECRSEMQVKKKEVDERHLQLQNLLYEKDHLGRTIQALRDFPLKELAKMEREEGAPLLPAHVTAGGAGRLLSLEEHRENMELLRKEKETRDQLHQEHAKAQRRREELAEELNQLRETLGTTLPRQIEDLDTLCSGLQERMQLPVAAPFGGFPLDDIKALPQALYILLGRLHAYIQAFDPKQRSIRASVLACADAKVLPVSVVVAGTEAARHAKTATAMDVEGEGEEGEDAVVVVVDPRAIQLEVMSVAGAEEDLNMAVDDDTTAATTITSSSNINNKDVVVFYFCPDKQEVLVSVPGRHPHALVNLLPGDVGTLWGKGKNTAANTPLLGAKAGQDTAAGGARRGRRRSSGKKQDGSGESDDTTPPPAPQSFMWLQWLGGTSPFPPKYMDLGPGYSSTCIFNRLRARLRAQRVLDTFLEGLAKQPKEVPKDESSPLVAQLFPSPPPGASSWEVTEFAEVVLASLAGGIDPFEERPGGIQAEVASTTSTGGGGGGEGGGMEEGAGGGGSGLTSKEKDAAAGHPKTVEGEGVGAWERAGARYFEVTLRKEVGEGKKDKDKALVVKVVVEITPEYPVRPARFRVCPSQLASKTTFQNAYANVLLEVNAHYDELLLGGTARDWILPHQLHKLLFCLNSMDLGNPSSFGHSSSKMRWGKDRRRSYTLDLHCSLLIPR